jgi:hypothetical protein
VAPDAQLAKLLRLAFAQAGDAAASFQKNRHGPHTAAIARQERAQSAQEWITG